MNSLERPGGNVTGVVARSEVRVARELSLLKEVVPGLTRVAAVFSGMPAEGARRLAEELELQFYSVGLASGDELAGAFEQLASASPQALFVGGGGWTLAQIAMIARQAEARGWPSVGEIRDLPAHGGLMSYGGLGDGPQRAAIYVDRILKGSDPADLPAELQQNWELVINLTSATQLGLTIPDSILAQAAELIR